MVGRIGDLMAEINTFQDLLDLLDSNPDYIDELRVRLLTPELIALPAKFAELVATVAHISTKLDEMQGLVDGSEVDNLHVADIIIRARRSAEARQVYAVFEVSRTINNRDIDRAYDRARSLATIINDETIAAVIGESAQPQQRERAAEKDVWVITPAMFRTQ